MAFTKLLVNLAKSWNERRILQHLQEVGLKSDQPQIRSQPGKDVHSV
jgi:hypothetical protein